jgi:hypothetical protein
MKKCTVIEENTKHKSYKLTYSMQQSPSCEADIHTVIQEIFRR